MENKIVKSIALTTTIIIFSLSMSLGMARAFMADTFSSVVKGKVGDLKIVVSDGNYDDSVLTPGDIRTYQVRVDNDSKVAALVQNDLYILNYMDGNIITEETEYIEVYPYDTEDIHIKEGPANKLETEYVELEIDGVNYKGVKITSEQKALDGSGVNAQEVPMGQSTQNFNYKIYFMADATSDTMNQEVFITSQTKAIQYNNSTTDDWEVIDVLEVIE